MLTSKKRDRLARVSAVCASLLIILTGIAALLRGNLVYSNYWGVVVFAPFAILLGVFVLWLVVFKWHRIGELTKDKKARHIRVPANKHHKR